MAVSPQLVNFNKIPTSSIALHPQVATWAAAAPRREILRLAQAVKATGLSGPIAVRPLPDGAPARYQLIVGALHWEAAVQATLPRMSAMICDDPQIDVVVETLGRLAVNPRRNPIEMAATLQTLMGLVPMATHQDLAALSGLARSVITHSLLLHELPSPVRRQLEQGKLSLGHAKLLCSRGLAGRPERQTALAAEAVKHRWSVRELQRAISGKPKEEGASPAPASAAGIVIDPNIRALVESLRELTGLQVDCAHQPSGAGRIGFSYHSLDELDNLLRHFPLR